MITDYLSFENDAFKILWYIRKSLNNLDFYYLFIWFGFMIIGIFIRIFSRLSGMKYYFHLSYSNDIKYFMIYL